jgi:hypothetical protein
MQAAWVDGMLFAARMRKAKRATSHTADYRVYVLNDDGRISKPAMIIQCDSDHQAIERAKKMKDRQALEVWHLDRRVTKIK